MFKKRVKNSRPGRRANLHGHLIPFSRWFRTSGFRTRDARAYACFQDVILRVQFKCNKRACGSRWNGVGMGQMGTERETKEAKKEKKEKSQRP